MSSLDGKIVLAVSDKELSELFLAKAKEHTDKAKIYTDQASRITLEDEDEGEGDELVTSYGNNMNQKLSQTKKDLKTKAREHSSKAALAAWCATHVNGGTHYLTLDEVRLSQLIS